jgi:hypothetical protein
MYKNMISFFSGPKINPQWEAAKFTDLNFIQKEGPDDNFFYFSHNFDFFFLGNICFYFIIASDVQYIKFDLKILKFFEKYDQSC